MPLKDLTRRTPHTSPHLQLPRHWSPHYAWWHLRAPRVLELSAADEVPKAIQQPSQWLKWWHCRWSLGKEKWKQSKILSPLHKEFFYTPPVAIGSGKRWFRGLESLLLEGSLSGSTVHPWGCMHGRYSKISASASSDCINRQGLRFTSHIPIAGWCPPTRRKLHLADLLIPFHSGMSKNVEPSANLMGIVCSNF